MNESVGIASVFTRVLGRELKIALRARGQWLNPLIFFVIVVSLFPLGIGPGPNTLQLIAPGILWVSALLSMLLSLDTLFARDYRDGTLEQYVLSDQPLSVVALAKTLGHWLLSGLPLVLISPLLGLFLQLESEAYGILIVSLAIGTLCLSLLGAIGAALIVSVNHGGVLLSLLVLPLTAPVLIFGSSAVATAASGQSAVAQLSLLAAMLLAAMSLAPIVVAMALRVGVAAGR